MKIIDTYSHLGGSEILDGRYPSISQEINEVIKNVTAKRTKKSKEQGRRFGKMLYDPSQLNGEFKREFTERGYEDLRLELDFKIKLKYKNLSRGGKQVDFAKDKVHIEVQFGKYAFLFHDMSKFQYSYNEGIMDVGVEIAATYKMAYYEMSSGVSYGEQLVNDIISLRRNYPAVPVKIIMVEP